MRPSPWTYIEGFPYSGQPRSPASTMIIHMPRQRLHTASRASLPIGFAQNPGQEHENSETKAIISRRKQTQSPFSLGTRRCDCESRCGSTDYRLSNGLKRTRVLASERIAKRPRPREVEFSSPQFFVRDARRGLESSRAEKIFGAAALLPGISG